MQKMNEKNIVRQVGFVSHEDRQKLMGHPSFALWFTGLSGSGKSTVSHTLEKKLIDHGCHAYVLDGDNIRHGVNSDLGFSPEDRVENIRRIGEVSRLFVDSGIITLSAFISPYRKDRKMVRDLFDEGKFIEVYVKCPLTECERRDVKGLYKKARDGKITDFTGISAPYEEPVDAEIVLDTEKQSVEESVEMVYNYLKIHYCMQV